MNDLLERLFPAKNRGNADNAAYRTFRQVTLAALVPSGFASFSGAQLAGADLKVIGFAAAAALISGVIGAAIAWTDVAHNGLSDKYTTPVE